MTRARVAVVVVLGVLGLACAGNPNQGMYGAQGAYGQPGYGQPGYGMQGQQGQQGMQGMQGQQGYPVGGPFPGPDGSSYYTDPMGRVTMLDGQGNVYLGTFQGQNVVIFGMRDAYGNWYSVDAAQNVAPVQGVPPQVSQWPAVASVPVAQAPRNTGSGGYSQQDMQMMMQMNQMYNDTNMTIINNMAPDSVDYYSSDNQYLGTW